MNVQSINGRPICSCGVNNGLSDARKENIANAKLIASAPQLKAENEKLKAEVRELVDALNSFKRLHLDNEANYPPGTVGHRLNETLQNVISKHQ